MLKKLVRLWLVTVILLVANHSIGLAQSGTPEQNSFTFITTSDVQIGAPWFVAKGKGFFAEEGLKNIKLESVSSLPTIYPRFVTGEVQAFASAEPPVLTLAAGGVPLKVVAVYSDQTGLHGVAALKDIKTAKDLEGKKVALQKGTIMEVLFRNFCATYGCDLSKVQILSMPAPESATALAEGSISAIASWQPFIGTAIDAGHDKGVHFLFYNKTSFMPGTESEHRKLHSAWSIVTVSSAFLKNNPNTVTALLRVLKKSIDFIHKHPKESASIIATSLHLPEDVAAQYLSAVIYDLAVTPSEVKEIQGTADYLASNKLIKAPVDFSGTMLDASLLKTLDPAAVTVGK